MEKLLIIGGSGLLGSHLVNRAKNEYEVVATFSNHPFEISKVKSIPLDITIQNKTEEKIVKERPHIIILTAAHRNVDFCEKNPKEAYLVNVEGAKNVAVASKKIQTKLIYLSTDLVFDGEKENYVEEDETNPINHYGRTKLEGEKAVQEICDDYAVARVSVLYDWNIFDHNTNFITWVYNRLKKGEKTELFSDQFRNITYVKNACDALLNIHKKDEKGIFHVVGKRCVDRHHIGKKVADFFYFDQNLITSTSSDNSTWLAKRPKKCCLNPNKMEKRLGTKPLDLEEGLAAMRVEMD